MKSYLTFVVSLLSVSAAISVAAEKRDRFKHDGRVRAEQEQTAPEVDVGRGAACTACIPRIAIARSGSQPVPEPECYCRGSAHKQTGPAMITTTPLFRLQRVLACGNFVLGEPEVPCSTREIVGGRAGRVDVVG